VDVMLVLLIIFLITIPVVTTSIQVDLPKERHEIRQARPETVIVSVNKAGQVFVYDTLIQNQADLQERLKKIAAMTPQPDVQIRGDAQGAYAPVGRVMHALQQAGIAQVGFVIDPGP
jgi:biopolymer transport protein ExbD